MTEDIEELKSEKALLLYQFACVGDQGMVEVKQRVTSMESSLKKLNQQEIKYADELNAAMVQYAELQQQATDMDTVELDTVRQAIRPSKEREAAQRLQDTYRKEFDSRLLIQSRKDVAGLLGEVVEPVSIRQKLQHLQQKAHRQSLEKERSQER